MSEWKTTEKILLRGGPRDGDELDVADASDLAPVLAVPTGSGGVASYRKTGEYEQLRGVGMAEAYSRQWFYDWLLRA